VGLATGAAAGASAANKQGRPRASSGAASALRSVGERLLLWRTASGASGRSLRYHRPSELPLDAHSSVGRPHGEDDDGNGNGEERQFAADAHRMRFVTNGGQRAVVSCIAVLAALRLLYFAYGKWLVPSKGYYVNPNNLLQWYVAMRGRLITSHPAPARSRVHFRSQQTCCH
jgi:hypothetical protein